ncbi:Oxidoreductase UcpA [Cladophialophora carrionii]|uniref:Oxidoreductase UcpA n=1 Tax=Cladophialophora carrionii TaxID=86049 RepID=A0A1C1CHU5_9EURO|nr:Oxidoreductase UcpA [Cladophialophora carrionii]
MGSLEQPQPHTPARPHTGERFTPTIHHDTYPAIDVSNSVGVIGKHVFLTGASRGIGKAMAIAYAKAGASIIGISARSEMEGVKREIEDEAVSAGHEMPTVVTVNMDVLDPDSVRQAIEQVTPEFQGRVDILISNAGYMEPWTKIVDNDVDEWWRSWDINIRGQYLLWKAMIPLMLANESSLKTIVNVSSIAAHVCSPGASAYQTTKFALLRLTDFLNVEYGDQGLIAYCMHPGSVPTELSWKMPDFVKVNLIDTPELMADSVVYLTQKRREWLRGRYVSCNWDMPELLAMQDEIVEKDKLKMRMVV